MGPVIHSFFLNLNFLCKIVHVPTGKIIMILGICGSPRKQATDYVLKKALKMLEERDFETEFFGVRGKNISPCRHCDYCMREGECIMKDDMYDVYPLLTAADGVIMATPVYNGGISAQLKAIMDRCRALGAVDFDFMRYKVGMAIAVGGDRIGGQELAIQQIMTFYILTGAIPVSGGAFGANLGANFWSQDTLEGVKKDEQGFRSLRKTVKRFATFLENFDTME
jgi:multimeric flavodoxin WrbA